MNYAFSVDMLQSQQQSPQHTLCCLYGNQTRLLMLLLLLIGLSASWASLCSSLCFCFCCCNNCRLRPFVCFFVFSMLLQELLLVLLLLLHHKREIHEAPQVPPLLQLSHYVAIFGGLIGAVERNDMGTVQ